MTAPTREDIHVLDIGPPAWCWSRLACASRATLSFSTSRGRFALDVHYSFDQGEVAILLPSLDSVGWQAAGRFATLKITGNGHDQLRWSVRATGYAHRAGTHLRGTWQDRSRSADQGGRAWLALPSPQVRGHYETIVLDSLSPDRDPGERP